MTREKPVGRNGSWYARLGDETIPCIHEDRLDGDQYHDNTLTPGQSRTRDAFVASIGVGLPVLVTRRKTNGRRDGYVSLRKVSSIAFDANGLRLGVTQAVRTFP